MEVKITKLTDWDLVRSLARTTVGKADVTGEVSEKFKHDMLNSEHSPIRALMFRIDLIGIPYWVSVHLVRHKFGVEHFVSTQRTDRTGVDRTEKTQDAPVNHTMILNAQELLFISRRRLCGKASEETRRVWQKVKVEMEKVDKAVGLNMIPMCLYRNGCFESESCGLFCKMHYLAIKDIEKNGI